MTKGAKEHTKADITGSALVGRGGMGLVPFAGDISYPLCDIDGYGYFTANRCIMF
ncbi:MAG: hypothetical protein NUW09_05165 [Deltaproteobacteria bacterium]|nr:hypothetical protein [Deltaproteobacteria bacterium]